MNSKQIFPNQKRIKLDQLSDSDVNLACFLNDCTPTKIHLFLINFKILKETAIKAEFYIKSLLRVTAAVTKKIYVRLLEFNAGDLQHLIRAGCNTERIVFRRCIVYCSTALDFGSKIKYNVKFLNFQNWGDTDCVDLTKDWKVDPFAF